MGGAPLVKSFFPGRRKNVHNNSCFYMLYYILLLLIVFHNRRFILDYSISNIIQKKSLMLNPFPVGGHFAKRLTFKNCSPIYTIRKSVIEHKFPPLVSGEHYYHLRVIQGRHLRNLHHLWPLHHCQRDVPFSSCLKRECFFWLISTCRKASLISFSK